MKPEHIKLFQQAMAIYKQEQENLHPTPPTTDKWMVCEETKKNNMIFNTTLTVDIGYVGIVLK